MGSRGLSLKSSYGSLWRGSDRRFCPDERVAAVAPAVDEGADLRVELADRAEAAPVDGALRDGLRYRGLAPSLLEPRHSGLRWK
jgi:hypothetical protein